MKREVNAGGKQFAYIRLLCGIKAPARPEPGVRALVQDNGCGAIVRDDKYGSAWLKRADSIPDLVLEVWELFHAGTITREEREQLHADIDAECGL